ncbi:hypothetical protein M2280_005938 [Prescottella agglutinans]|uniref:Helicase-associated domain-containing protein n=1 Tax=Prescottella agglutinans TaxID=1644129 RepID=A0ABT6MK56_9NOCA|nr:hypothetical protein [Prescottella agglutinans]
MHGGQAIRGVNVRSHALWVNGIEHLEDFVTEHGHARVLAGFVCSDGMRLGAWVSSRRAEYRHGARSLTDERIAQLDALGFVWDPPQGRIDEYTQKWAVGIAHLERYVAVHGHARVPFSWVSEAGFALGRWVNDRRRDRRDGARALTPERLAQLDALGFDWGTKDRDTPTGRQSMWAAGIDHLEQFITEHGHARVPDGWASPDGFKPRHVGEEQAHRPPHRAAIAEHRPDRPTRQPRIRLGKSPDEHCCPTNAVGQRR